MGTVGDLFVNGVQLFKTLELPWLNNERNVSCIPDGKYKCSRIISPKFGNVFEIINVKNRSNVLLHKGNYLRDTSGCILIGSYDDEENGEFVIYKSKEAFSKFMDLLKDFNEFDLEIV